MGEHMLDAESKRSSYETIMCDVVRRSNSLLSLLRQNDAAQLVAAFAAMRSQLPSLAELTTQTDDALYARALAARVSVQCVAQSSIGVADARTRRTCAWSGGRHDDCYHCWHHNSNVVVVVALVRRNVFFEPICEFCGRCCW